MTELIIKDKTTTDETIKIEPFRKNIRQTKPHKHNKYLEFIYFSKASGYHVIDNFKIEIKQPVFFIVRKEQVHYWNLNSEPEGYVIIIKESFISQCLDIEIKQQFLKISAFSYLEPENNITIEQLFILLSKENTNPNNKTVIEGLLKALLGKLLQIESPKQPQNTSIYHKYLELLHAQEKLSNSVKHYANLLNTSPQNLNTNCRNECDKSASEILSDFILSEAKRLLIYSEKNISDIAYSLSFRDNSHFTKYFKRHVGQTPSEFKANTSYIP
ncbi:helix-turn-helix domain-containing protein [Algibacter miyuki]|uniref:Helix-turn-helix domain-containing protein n=1 Tax=Algibacter miyuki TaxID=1306933 RepID=A0ABV5GUE7_9FLAO|nr:helix-turn-helix transcriptional regulator [Algibacter miyuki]MDN3664591.1 helix-turn-helix transcriptional regulator [Algibacter miyuki]